MLKSITPKRAPMRYVYSLLVLILITPFLMIDIARAGDQYSFEIQGLYLAKSNWVSPDNRFVRELAISDMAKPGSSIPDPQGVYFDLDRSGISIPGVIANTPVIHQIDQVGIRTANLQQIPGQIVSFVSEKDGLLSVKKVQFEATSGITWFTFEAPLPEGRYVIGFDGQVALTGEYSHVSLAELALVSSLTFTLKPGDINHDGAVNQYDLQLMGCQVGNFPSSVIYQVMHDVNGDGSNDFRDCEIVQQAVIAPIPSPSAVPAGTPSAFESYSNESPPLILPSLDYDSHTTKPAPKPSPVKTVTKVTCDGGWCVKIDVPEDQADKYTSCTKHTECGYNKCDPKTWMCERTIGRKPTDFKECEANNVCGHNTCEPEQYICKRIKGAGKNSCNNRNDEKCGSFRCKSVKMPQGYNSARCSRGPRHTDGSNCNPTDVHNNCVHGACFQKQCVMAEGESSDYCSPKAGNNICLSRGICTPNGTCQAPDPNKLFPLGKGDWDSRKECAVPKDPNALAPECTVAQCINGECMRVPVDWSVDNRSLDQTCQDDSDCIHFACESNGRCAVIKEPGVNSKDCSSIQSIGKACYYEEPPIPSPEPLDSIDIDPSVLLNLQNEGSDWNK